MSRSPRRTLIAALTVALLVAISACTSARSATGEGGTLRVGIGNDIVPAAIFTSSNDGINLLIGQVYDNLVDYPVDGLEPEPSLATDWELAEDGLSLALGLRDDVTFHTGREFTSADVEFSVRTWADPKWTVQLQRTAAAVTGFDTSDPHRIVLEFDHPISNIFDLLDMLPIIDSETFDELETGDSYVGTGAFEFVSWSPGSSLSFIRNEDYWRGAPELEAIEVSITPNAQASVSQLRSGQLDVIVNGSARDLDSLADTGDYTVTELEGSERQTYVGTNVSHPALSDVRLRQAIAYAVDRERIVDEVYRGVGYAINLPWPRYSPAFDEEKNETYARDVEAAQDLVAQIGDVPNLPLEYAGNNPAHEAIAQIVQANLEEVGITVDLIPGEQAQLVQKLIGQEFEALWILDHLFAQWTPSTLTVSAYPFNANSNTSLFDDDDYRTHADTAWKTPDGLSDEALAAYDQLSDDLLEHLFLIEFAITFNRIAANDAVSGFTWTKRGEPRFYETTLG